MNISDSRREDRRRFDSRRFTTLYAFCSIDGAARGAQQIDTSSLALRMPTSFSFFLFFLIRSSLRKSDPAALAYAGHVFIVSHGRRDGGKDFFDRSISLVSVVQGTFTNGVHIEWEGIPKRVLHGFVALPQSFIDGARRDGSSWHEAFSFFSGWMERHRKNGFAGSFSLLAFNEVTTNERKRGSILFSSFIQSSG